MLNLNILPIYLDEDVFFDPKYYENTAVVDLKDFHIKGVIKYNLVDEIEIEEVRVFIVGVPGGISEVDFVFSVGGIFGIGACAGALHYLIGAPGFLHFPVGAGQGELGDGGMPVYAAPAEVEVLRIVREDEGRGIGSVVLRGDFVLRAEGADVARLLRNAVVEAGFVGMAGIKDHDALVGEDEECGIVVVVGLEIGAYEDFGLLLFQEIVLHGLDAAVHVDVAHVAGVDGPGGIFIM